MRSLDAVRAKARAVRPETATHQDLLDHTWAWIENEGYDLSFETAAFLQDGAALLSPDEDALYLNESLRDDADGLLITLAHERGHLELHERVRRASGPVDPVAGSAYVGDGAAATARYHRHSREEAEATAFATEYVCPSDGAFDRWMSGADVAKLARSYGVREGVVRVQLGQALFDRALGADGADGDAGAQDPDDETTRVDDNAQRGAAEHVGSPALVRAGPGTGKTATLVRRVAHLLGPLGADPESVLVLTFSNDAAEEVRARVANHFDTDVARRLEIQTFHGFGWSVLRSYGDLVGLTDEARILDETGVEEVVSDLIGRPEFGPLFNLPEAEQSVRRAAEAITRVKDRVGRDDLPVTPDTVAAALTGWKPTGDEVDDYARSSAFLDLFRSYEAEKLRRQRADFADLIALPERILREHPDEVRDRAYRAKYRWVLVDEYQDVSRTVARLLQQLCGPNNPLWAVGDKNQAIYRFRGADPDNVVAFETDFTGGKVYDLGTNYRACPELVAEASRLAALIDDPALEGEVEDERWSPRTSETPTAFGATPVRIFEAESAAGELAGVVGQVKAWLADDVPAEDIAVLARTNAEVRDVVLALAQEEITGAASALVTADGPAGALAAVVTVPERPRPSLPRLAQDLGRGLPKAVVNEAVRRLLNADAGEDETDAGRLANRVLRTVEALHAARFSEDGFGMMAVYLFDVGALRTVLAEPNGARRALDLSEVMTALTRAAGYRFTHADASVHERRVGFGQHFRRAVAATSPSYVPAPHPPDAVRVMTLHASKGLEFPLVALMGQVRPNIPAAPQVLPPSLRPDPDEEANQSDAALFVGVTRAERALTVSFAPKKTPGARAHQQRAVPDLLRRWPAAGGIAVETWPHIEGDVPKPDLVPAVWGTPDIDVLSASSLGPTACELSVYLGRGLGLEFPSEVTDLYPRYVGALRRALIAIAEESTTDAEAALDAAWETAPDHPHTPAYRDAALGAIGAFADWLAAYGGEAPLTTEVELSDEGPTVRLGLVARSRRGNGGQTAVAVHTRGPLLPKLKTDKLSWSSLGSSAQATFAALYGVEGGTSPDTELYVLSVADRAVLPAAFKRGGVAKEAEAVAARARVARTGPYVPAADDRTCPSCEQRTVCPFWLGLADE